MMQVTRAAFQAKASLNQQGTDTKSHTLVRTFDTRFSSVPLPAIPMVDTKLDTPRSPVSVDKCRLDIVLASD